jgi:hypothetical protein
VSARCDPGLLVSGLLGFWKAGSAAMGAKPPSLHRRSRSKFLKRLCCGSDKKFAPGLLRQRLKRKPSSPRNSVSGMPPPFAWPSCQSSGGALPPESGVFAPSGRMTTLELPCAGRKRTLGLSKCISSCSIGQAGA